MYPRVNERDPNPPHARQLVHSQDLVFFSILVAVLASLYGADHDQPGEPEPGTGRRALARGGAFAMGLGIWSMHFIGMLASQPAHRAGIRSDPHRSLPWWRPSAPRPLRSGW